MELCDAMFWNEKPGEIFGCGTSKDTKDGGVNFQLTGKAVRWIAVKGGNDDWAIYFDYQAPSIEYLKRYGYKLSVENVPNLIKVSDAVLARYRK